MIYPSDDRPALPRIEITGGMIDAGAAEFSELRFASDPRVVVEAVYLAMQIEKLAQEISSATLTSPSR